MRDRICKYCLSTALALIALILFDLLKNIQRNCVSYRKVDFKLKLYKLCKFAREKKFDKSH